MTNNAGQPRRKTATTDELRKLVQWLTSDECGLSSTTIACVMAGAACGRPATPVDDDDFGRCHRLLQRFPGFRSRLDEVADAYPEWRPIVARWTELKTAHQEGDVITVHKLLEAARADTDRAGRSPIHGPTSPERELSNRDLLRVAVWVGGATGVLSLIVGAPHTGAGGAPWVPAVILAIATACCVGAILLCFRRRPNSS